MTATAATAESAFLAAFTARAAAGGAIYVFVALGAVLLACLAAAQRLMPAADADRVATQSLLQFGVVALVVLGFVVFAWLSWDAGAPSRALRFPWAWAIGLVGIVAAGLGAAMPQSAPLKGLEGGDLAGALRAVGSDAIAAAVLAAVATIGAGVDYATGNSRADRTGGVASVAACAACVSAAVFFVLVQVHKLYGLTAAVFSAVAIALTFVASSWLAGRAANAVAGYDGAPVVASSPGTARAAEQSRRVVSSLLILSVLLPLLVLAGTRASPAVTGAPDGAPVDTTALIVVCAGLALWIPAVAVFAAGALRVREIAPVAYASISTLVLAVAVYCAGRLLPWTATLLWAGVFVALASFVNMAIRGADGGARKLQVALMLVAGFAAAQIVGAKLAALVPAALVLFALWRTGRPVAPALIFAAALLWSAVDPAPAPATDAPPAVVVGRTAAALAAALLIASEAFAVADSTLGYGLANLGAFSVTNTEFAQGLGRAILLALLGLLTRDAVRGVFFVSS